MVQRDIGKSASASNQRHSPIPAVKAVIPTFGDDAAHFDAVRIQSEVDPELGL